MLERKCQVLQEGYKTLIMTNLQHASAVPGRESGAKAEDMLSEGKNNLKEIKHFTILLNVT